MSELGKLGAKARFEKLTPERRSEIARQAGIASGLMRRSRKCTLNKTNIESVVNQFKKLEGIK